MGLKDYFKKILWCLNPNNYGELVSDSMLGAQKYLIFSILFYMFLTIILFSPAIYFFYKDLGSNLEKLNTLNVTVDVDTKDAVYLTKNPLVVIDTQNTEGLTNQKVLLTKDKLYLNTFYAKKDIPILGLDLLPKLSKLEKMIVILSFLLIPTLLFASFIFMYFTIAVI